MLQFYNFRFFSFLIIFFCTVFSLAAQSVYLEAKLVKNTGDTLSGHINFYDWDISPTEIEFKQSFGGPIQILAASDIHAFYLLSRKEWYYSKTIKINYYSNRIAENSSIVGHSVSGTFFLNEVLQGSLISLYMLADEYKNLRYFVQKDSTFSELLQYEYTAFREGKQYSLNVNQYINQLKILIADCPSVKVSSTLEYSQAALSHLFKRYHECQEGTVKSQADNRKIALNPVIIPSLFKLTNNNIYIKTIGIGLRLSPPNKFRNRYALIQLDRYMYDYTERGIIRKGSSHHVTALAGTYLGKHKIQPFIHAGLQIPSSIIGVTIGAGISYNKKFSLEVRSPGFAGIMGSVYYTFGKTSSSHQ